MTKRRLSAVSRSQGNNLALKSGSIALPDFELSFEEVDPLVQAFRRMVREQAYDVSEMALTTYITARAYGVPITAIPVFLVRDFHHKAIVVSNASRINSAKQLEGRRVGVDRGYTVTTNVWARSILAEEHDVNLARVTWARSSDEHVANWRRPANVEELGGEGSLTDQIASGAIPAAVGRTADERCHGLIPDAFSAGLDAFRNRGLYPINHLVVIRDELLIEVPDIARQLFDAFTMSKRKYVSALKAGHISELSQIDNVHLAVLETLDDPLPYGISPNQHVLEFLISQAVAQGIIDEPIPLERLFAATTLECTG